MDLKYPLFIFATAAAFLVKGVTGFGNTLLMTPLYSFAAPNRLITPVDLLLGLPANVVMAWRERAHISWRVVLPLSALVIAGIVPGALLLKAGDDRLLKSALGLAVVAAALEMFLRKTPAGGRKNNPVLLGALALVSGVLCGLYGIGALLAAYVSRTTDSMGAFRANLCLVFLAENLFRVVFYLATGVLTGEALALSLWMAPAAAAGLAAGIVLGRRLKPEHAKRAAAALIAASGAALFIRNLF